MAMSVIPFAYLCLLFLGFLSPSASSGDLTYLDGPRLLWNEFTFEVSQRNGVFLSPDESMLVATSVDGLVRAFAPLTGLLLWEFQPPSRGFSIRCQSGVTFNYIADEPYIVYSIIDDAGGTNEAT